MPRKNFSVKKRKVVSVKELLKRFKDPKVPKSFEETLAEWNKIHEAEYEANRRAESVGPEDWAIVRSALGFRLGF